MYAIVNKYRTPEGDMLIRAVYTGFETKEEAERVSDTFPTPEFNEVVKDHRSTQNAVDWSAVSSFVDGILEEKPAVHVRVASPVLGKEMSVIIPEHSVEAFIKNLPLYHATVISI